MKLIPKKLSQLGRVVTGKTPPTRREELFGGSFLFITPSDLDYEHYYCRETERTVSEEARSLLPNQFIPADAVMVTCIGATIGKCGLAPGDCLTNQQINSVVPHEDTDAKFLYYLMCMETENIRRLGGGAATPIVSKSKFEEIELLVPSFVTQQSIGRVLSSYDDLIENNRRRMALLEEAARQLYREWFVRLRFPGHEHTSVVDDAPEGWALLTVDDLCCVGRGASPRPIAEFMDGDIPWFKIGDATASESPFVLRTKEHVIDDGARKSIILEPPALILSNSATCGIPFFAGVRGCIHDGWLHFSQIRRVSQEFLYCFLYEKQAELVSSVSDGSTQKNLNTTAVGRLKLLLPRAEALLTAFNESVQPLFACVLNLAQQNVKLRAARDLLLPRLMSGEIAV